MSMLLLTMAVLATGSQAGSMPLTVSQVAPGNPGHVRITNTSRQAITAWSLATTTVNGDRTHRDLTTADGYLSEVTHGLPGANERLERLDPGQSREIPLDPLPAGATVDVMAVVLEDGTAIGDETVIASVFAHRVKERDALRAVVDSFTEVLANRQGTEALAALRDRFAALAQRDDSVPCHAALDAVQNYSQKSNPDEINQSLRTYAAFVTKEYDLAAKHATRKT